MAILDWVTFQLRSFQVTFAQQASGTYGDFGLGNIPAYPKGIQIGIKEHHDSVLLMGG
jgi:hypothetical protein